MTTQERLTAIRGAAKDVNVPMALVDYVLNKPEFALWSGSSKPGQHHYGTGGLLRHTQEVLAYSLVNAGIARMFGKEVDGLVLFLASLYHDVGKIWDYAAFNPEGAGVQDAPLNLIEISNKPDLVVWRGVGHKREIHHISRSAIEFSKAVALTGEGKDIEDKVLHCILSHHGTREWGSPVAPKSREAWLLFLCDGISARTTDCDTSDMIGKVKSG